MSLDGIRRLGAGILASAGIATMIVAFSAKGILESVFNGIQLAITQLIRVNDIIVIEGDWTHDGMKSLVPVLFMIRLNRVSYRLKYFNDSNRGNLLEMDIHQTALAYSVC